MSIIIIVIIVALVGGIIYVNRSSSQEANTRENFLSSLAEFLEGKLEPHGEYEDSFKIAFTFEGHKFIYEDLQLPGFKEKVNKAYLKTMTSSSLTLRFEERKETSEVLRSNLNIFNKPGSSPKRSKMKVPNKLKCFQIQTDEPGLVEKIFSNPKCIKILNAYKNVDPRGIHFSSLGINKGWLVLAFSKDKRYYPNLPTIRKNVHILEDHLRELITLTKIIESHS